MSTNDKPILWYHGEVKSPPFSRDARMEAGFLLRQLQAGISLGMPESRPMATIGRRCHELRIQDGNSIWRIIYRLDEDAVVVVDVFQKKTKTTPAAVIKICKTRLKGYDNACR